jgi:hypothetical protein
MKKLWGEDLTNARKMIEFIRNNADFQLQASFLSFTAGGNPYWAWNAIKVCTEHKREFPTWVFEYLRSCSERMFSDECADRMMTKEGSDLRKVLPWVFDFPTDKKKGPGNLLRPYGVDPAKHEKLLFAWRFAILMKNTEGEIDPGVIMRAASSELFPAGAEEKTLWRWLLKELGLKKRPRTADEWRAVAREYYLPKRSALLHIMDTVSRDSDVH